MQNSYFINSSEKLGFVDIMNGCRNHDNSAQTLAKDTFSVFRWRLPLLILLMVMSGFFEGLAVATALPLLQSLSEISALIVMKVAFHSCQFYKM